MTFVFTPWSHYNSVTKPRAHFLFSLLVGHSIDFPTHIIVSMIDIYQDTATRDELIFPLAITRILYHGCDQSTAIIQVAGVSHVLGSVQRS